MAYLFIADEDGSAETADPTGGRNALLIQPEGRIPPNVEIVPHLTGPTLLTRGASWDDMIPTEVDINLVGPESDEERQLELMIEYDENARRGSFGELPRGDSYPLSYVGGRALYSPGGHVPVGDEWDFFFQLEGGEGWDGDLYALNFGGGIGYGYLASDSLEGRFFWAR